MRVSAAHQAIFLPDIQESAVVSATLSLRTRALSLFYDLLDLLDLLDLPAPGCQVNQRYKRRPAEPPTLLARLRPDEYLAASPA